MGLPIVASTSAAVAIFYPVFGVTNLAGYLMGAIMDGDLDQIGLSSAEGRAMRAAGCVGVLWVMYWMPYAYIMPHRSFLSHFPYVSTAIRLAYLFAPILVLAFHFGVLGYLDHPIVFAGLFGLWSGLGQADMIHYILDILHKPIRRK